MMTDLAEELYAAMAAILIEVGWTPLCMFGPNTGPWVPPQPMERACYSTGEALQIIGVRTNG